MIFDRQTLANEFEIEGLGLHTGAPVRMRVFPGENGIRFRCGSTVVTAHPENVSDTSRCTRLGEISTVEHLMSAFAGTEITDAEVELSTPELPGMDGSAIQFVEAIESVGKAKLGERELPNLFTRLYLQEELIKVAIAKGTGHWRFEYETGERWPGSMPFDTQNVLTDYREQIAPARTFALSEEIPMILQYGLGKGLDHDTALVLDENGYRGDVRFADEPARHKLLDLIGDLYLAGVPLKFLNVVGTRSGHRTHVAIAVNLAKSLQIGQF
jgi:UDP-3-O-[3-hydroxymyristoyl] N-acetylglucosamine deacetylase